MSSKVYKTGTEDHYTSIAIDMQNTWPDDPRAYQVEKHDGTKLRISVSESGHLMAGDQLLETTTYYGGKRVPAIVRDLKDPDTLLRGLLLGHEKVCLLNPAPAKR